MESKHAPSSVVPFAGVVVLTALLAGAARAQDADAASTLRALFVQSLAAGPGSSAAGDLRRAGAPAVEFLKGVLATGTDHERAHAVRLLMHMGPAAQPAVPELMAAARGDGTASVAALIALGELGPFAADAALRGRIRDTVAARAARSPGDVAVQMEAARVWSRLRVTPTRDVQQLITWLADDDPFVIELACQLLVELGPAAQPAMPLVAAIAARPTIPAKSQPDAAAAGIHYNGDRTRAVRAALLVVFQRVAPDDPASVPLLLDRLAGAQPDEQIALVRQLGRIGTGAAAAAPTLVRLARAPSPALAREAVVALGLVGVRSPQVRELLEALRDGKDAQLAACARAALRLLEREPQASSR